MLGNQLLNFISEIEKISTDLDPVYTTCEAGKRRSVNHTRARARSPRRAEAVGAGVARPDVRA